MPIRFSLCSITEWQKECGIHLAPQDPLVLALERDRKKEPGKLKRCCSACSIAQRCLKPKGNQKKLEECAEDFVSHTPPRRCWVGCGRPARADEHETSDEGGAPPGGASPSLLGLEVRWDLSIIQAPLKQAMGPGAPTLIRIPFQMEDIDKWRETTCKGIQGRS